MNSVLNTLNFVLEDFRIKGECVDYNKKYNYNIYSIKLTAPFTVKKLQNRLEDISLNMRWEHKPTVEVSNGLINLIVADNKKTKIDLSSIITKTSNITVGVSANGDIIDLDLNKSPHILVAGTTGSGKSVFLNAIIGNFILRNSYDEIYLIDPKYVEFSKYKNINYNGSIIIKNTYEDAICVFEYIERKLQKRLNTLQNSNSSNIEEHNSKSVDKLNRIVVIVDEYADLKFADKDGSLELMITRLVAKSRAAGIHIILATQRPSREVITGLIKANFTTRICFKVSSGVDSRVVLDKVGAENLSYMGDGILHGYFNNDCRFQSAYY